MVDLLYRYEIRIEILSTYEFFSTQTRKPFTVQTLLKEFFGNWT